MDMAIYHVELQSMSPLLMHNPDSMKPRDDKPGRQRIPKPEDEARASAYRLPDGQLYLKADMFRGSLLNACVGQRVGRKAAKPVFNAALFTTDREVSPLVDPTTRKPLTTWETDTRRVVVQNQGIIRARARVPHWLCEVEFEFDPDMLAIEWIDTMLALAGKISGVGDYRPSAPKGKGGPYGRFIVASEGVAR
jgi:hypothetical protein